MKNNDEILKNVSIFSGSQLLVKTKNKQKREREKKKKEDGSKVHWPAIYFGGSEVGMHECEEAARRSKVP